MAGGMEQASGGVVEHRLSEEDYLEPVYEKLHRQLVQHEILYADETTLQVLFH